jgi:hypothetical protein
VYLLEYGMTRSAYDALRKNYAQARECVFSPPAARSADTVRQLEPRVAAAEDELARDLRQARAGVPRGPRVPQHALPPPVCARRRAPALARRALTFAVYAYPEVRYGLGSCPPNGALTMTLGQTSAVRPAERLRGKPMSWWSDRPALTAPCSTTFGLPDLSSRRCLMRSRKAPIRIG